MAAEFLTATVFAVLVAAVARRFGLSSPLVLVVAGLFATLLPNLPKLVLDPEFVLFVILPPLLWTAGLESSYLDLRKNLASITSLAIGLPLATMAAVGLVAYQVVPEMTLAAAFVLGAIVAPPDAVSATAVGRKLGLPRRMMTLIGGESLLNDATALTAYKVALAAAIGLTQTWDHALGVFLWAVSGGVLIGLGLGMLLVVIRNRLSDPLVESTIGLVAPFVCYLVAEQLEASGVLAVVVASLYLGTRSIEAGYATRLQDQAVWRSVQLVLESLAFLLIGLQLPTVIDELTGIPAWELVISPLAVLATLIAVRMLWTFGYAYLTPRFMDPALGSGPRPRPAEMFILGWAGMRGVVSLAAAFAIPMTTLTGEEFPGRPVIVFVTFVVVIGGLMLHGLTLPWLVRRLGLARDDDRADALARVAARAKSADAAAERLEELLEQAQQSGEPMEPYQTAGKLLRVWNERRRDEAWYDQMTHGEEGPGPGAVYRLLRLEMLAAERETLIAERRAERIDDETLRSLIHDLDLLEASLTRQAGKGPRGQ